MSLPQFINTNVPHGLEALGKGASRIREAKQFFCDVFGIADGVSTTSPFFDGIDDGMIRVFLIPSTTNPSLTGAVRAIGHDQSSMLALYDGNNVQHINGTLHYEFPSAAIGNVGGGEDVLMDYTFPTGFFDPDDSPNRAIEIIAHGIFANNGNTKTLKIRLTDGSITNSYTLNPTTTAPNNKYWRFHGVLWREDAIIVDDTFILMSYCAIDPGSTEASLHLVGGNLEFDTSLDPTAAVTIAFTGQSGSSTSDDVTQQSLLVRQIY